MGSERTDHWEQIYAAKAEGDLSWFQERPAASLDLIARAGLAKEARILDVGGGASHLVDHLLASGYGQVSILDLSPSALAQAQRRLGPDADRATWIVADITQWRPVESYDLWHDRAVFHFLTDARDRAAYREVMRRSLRPNGQAIFGTFALDGPERCSGLPVVRYSPASLAAELGAAFRLLDTIVDAHRTPGGATQRFQFSRFVRLDPADAAKRPPRPGAAPGAERSL